MKTGFSFLFLFPRDERRQGVQVQKEFLMISVQGWILLPDPAQANFHVIIVSLYFQNLGISTPINKYFPENLNQLRHKLCLKISLFPLLSMHTYSSIKTKKFTLNKIINIFISPFSPTLVLDRFLFVCCFLFRLLPFLSAAGVNTLLRYCCCLTFPSPSSSHDGTLFLESLLTQAAGGKCFESERADLVSTKLFKFSMEPMPSLVEMAPCS